MNTLQFIFIVIILQRIKKKTPHDNFFTAYKMCFFNSTKKASFFLSYENYIFRKKKPYYERVTIQFRQMMHSVIVYY